jgi:PAS domain S-box-containing protein
MNNGNRDSLKKKVDGLEEENRRLKGKLTAGRKERRVLAKALEDCQELIDQLPAGLLLIQKGRIVFANGHLLKQLGYNREELLSRPLLDLLQSDSTGLHRIIQGKAPPLKPATDYHQAYLLTKSGERRVCEVRERKIKYRGKSSLLLNIVDINQRNKDYNRFLQQRKTEALMKTVSGLDKEFNQCLSLLKTYVRNLEDSARKPSHPSFSSGGSLQALLDRQQRLTELMGRMSKTKYSKYDISLFDLKKVVTKAIASVRNPDDAILRQRIPLVQFKTYLRSISQIKGNPAEMQIALVNVLMNALDAMPHGGRVYVTTEEDSTHAIIYIQDDGIGITEEMRDRIFDPFSTDKRGLPGLGLGLSVAQAIILRHKGQITAFSPSGQGTLFTIKVPVHKISMKPTVRSSTKRIRNSKILIITEKELTRDLLSRSLRSKGAKVNTASDLLEGLRVLKKSTFDLLIADPDHFNATYLEILPKIRLGQERLAVALIGPPRGTKKSWAANGLKADLILQKPLDMDRVLLQVSKLIANELQADEDKPN